MIGRRKEFNTLQRIYNKEGFGLAVICGRRGVGKTTMISEFCRDKRTLFFVAEEARIEKNLREFSRIVFSEAGITEFLEGQAFQNLKNLFSSLGPILSGEKPVIVIDDLPYLTQADPSVLPALTGAIEYELSGKNVLLILSGSLEDGMEGIFSEKGPLAGRASELIRFQPFDYLETAEYVPEYSEEDKALVYGVTGGVPAYLRSFDPKISVWDNIGKLFFTKCGALYNEPLRLLRREFRNVMLYHTILYAIGSGAGRMNEIVRLTGYETPVLSPAVKKLLSLGILKKDIPVFWEGSRKDAAYVISDNLLRFYYYAVAGSRIGIERGEPWESLVIGVRPFVSSFMEGVFPEICGQYLLRRTGEGSLSFPVSEIGAYRGYDPARKEAAEIDLVALNEGRTEAVVGTCRYKSSGMDAGEIDACFANAELLKCQIRRYLMFSKNGYYPSVLRRFRETENVELLTLKELY